MRHVKQAILLLSALLVMACAVGVKSHIFLEERTPATIRKAIPNAELWVNDAEGVPRATFGAIPVGATVHSGDCAK